MKTTQGAERHLPGGKIRVQQTPVTVRCLYCDKRLDATKSNKYCNAKCGSAHARGSHPKHDGVAKMEPYRPGSKMPVAHVKPTT